MLGINRSNIIICTGLICALLSYAEWAQIPDSPGTHLPLVWNWAKVQKFLVTTYSDLPSGLCAPSSMDYIHLPNGISRHFCVSGKKPRKQNENLLSMLTRRMVVRAARRALALAAEPGLPALPAVCLLEEAMYSFRPAICLTPALLTGARDVPKLLLGSVSSKSRRKSGLQKTLLLFVVCSCLGEETGYAEPKAAAAVPKARHPYLRLMASQLTLQKGLHFSPQILCFVLLCLRRRNTAALYVNVHQQLIWIYLWCSQLSKSRLWHRFEYITSLGFEEVHQPVCWLVCKIKRKQPL